MLAYRLSVYYADQVLNTITMETTMLLLIWSLITSLLGRRVVLFLLMMMMMTTTNTTTMTRMMMELSICTYTVSLSISRMSLGGISYKPSSPFIINNTVIILNMRT